MIVMLLTTNNEADVLKLNLAHHLAWGVDHIVVCDNRSVDETPEVVRSFGSAVTWKPFRDTRKRQEVRMRGLEQLRECQTVSWAGVSDTDEFFWAPDTTIRELLAEAPADVVAVTFHQKLYLPTQMDPPQGPVYRRQLYRTGSYNSPLHLSYVRGKTFYRAAWLNRITSEHFCKEVPHPPWAPFEPLVHHYMIRDEDQFVMKVKRLRFLHGRLHHRIAWRFGFRTELNLANTSFKGNDHFKRQWWNILVERGEEGLRNYYRDEYCLSPEKITENIETGDLVKDTAFAEWKEFA